MKHLVDYVGKYQFGECAYLYGVKI